MRRQRGRETGMNGRGVHTREDRELDGKTERGLDGWGCRGNIIHGNKPSCSLVKNDDASLALGY